MEAVYDVEENRWHLEAMIEYDDDDFSPSYSGETFETMEDAFMALLVDMITWIKFE